MVLKKATFYGDPVEATEDWNPDARKEDAIASELASSGLVDATEVHVTVKGEEARLTGEVYLREEIAVAGNIALSVEGIKRVRNAIHPKERHLRSTGKEDDARAQSRTL
ncbi:BON domain-containing protein [Martelella soudanensis]|uniref:BON domain-containing protein n=1 Tax=unclassified Martelella TaxID=2629616 RepID=UPI0015DDDF12|nr:MULTISPECIES: BON domain-containing protein [unclassified Martelella]